MGISQARGVSAVSIHVKDDGVTIVTQAYILNFKGSVTVTDAGNGQADIEITGGGGGSITEIDGSTGIDVTDPTGPVVTVALADTIVTPGTYGDSTHVGVFEVDQQGRLIAASNVAISGSGGDGSLTLNERTVSTSFTIDDAAPPPDGVIVYNGAGSDTGTMIDAGANPGRIIYVKNVAVGQLIMDATGLGQFFVLGRGLIDVVTIDPDGMMGFESANGNWQVQFITGLITNYGGVINNDDLIFIDDAGVDAAEGFVRTGRFLFNERTVSGNFTLDDGSMADGVIVYDGAGGDTGTMIDAATNDGRTIIVKNSGTGTLFFDAAGLGQFFTNALVDNIHLAVGDEVILSSADGHWQVGNIIYGAIGASGGLINGGPLSFQDGASIDITAGGISVGGSNAFAQFVGVIYLGFRTVSANFTVDDGPDGEVDYTLIYTGPGGETGTLVDASDWEPRVLRFKNSGGGDLTLDAAGLGQFFTTGLVDTLILSVGDAVELQAANGAWQVM